MIKLSVGEIVCSLSWGRGGLLIILDPLRGYLCSKKKSRPYTTKVVPAKVWTKKMKSLLLRAFAEVFLFTENLGRQQKTLQDVLIQESGNTSIPF